MTDSDRFDELAQRIGDGQPVDWNEITDSGDLDPDLARQLQALGKISDAVLRSNDHFRVRLNDRYRLVDRLSAEGTGEVYTALREHLGDLVAIKLLTLSSGEDPTVREHLEKEVKVLAKIKHPNVAQVYDLDSHEGQDFIVMELVPGETLRKRLLNEGRLSEQQAIELTLQMLAGLSEAHANGVVHHNLKPENLIVTPDGNLKILDFGIAKEKTTPYMAPEQILDKTVDVRADLYAVGVILAELVTGKKPYRVSAEVSVREAILSQDPVPVRERNAKVSQELETCVLRLLSKDPIRRHASAKELADDLRAIHTRYFSEARGVEAPVQTTNRRPQLALRTLVHRFSKLFRLR